MLEIKGLSIQTRTGKPIISDLNLIIDKGDKLAVIGEEGNGKSTLLKAILNIKEVDKYCYTSGKILKDNLKIGYLEQSLNELWNERYIYEYFLADSPLNSILGERYESLKYVSTELPKIGISSDILKSERKINTLSGGEKVKIQIVKVLISNPDILLLDEPTNDLDIETLEWLETFINESKIPIIYVSHDETLLERTANRILHMEYVKSKKEARHTLQKGDFKTYVNMRKTEIEKSEKDFGREKRDYLKAKKVLSRRKSIVRSAQERIKDSTTRRILNKEMRVIKSRERVIEERRRTERIETEEPSYFSFDIKSRIPNGKRVIDFKLDKLKVENKVLAKNIYLEIYGPEKIGIIGKNGVGKTTLLREIYTQLKEREDLDVGYMPQDYLETLDEDINVLEYLSSNLEGVDMDKIVADMGRIKLNWEEMNSDISSLSYGQRAKLILLKMMVDKKNILLLDEPTRNLSALSNPVIRDVLRDFNGCILSISHDRKFLKEVCNTVYRLEEEGLKKIEIE